MVKRRTISRCPKKISLRMARRSNLFHKTARQSSAKLLRSQRRGQLGATPLSSLVCKIYEDPPCPSPHEEETSNIEHPTPNTEWQRESSLASAFDVRCWAFDVFSGPVHHWSDAVLSWAGCRPKRLSFSRMVRRETPRHRGGLACLAWGRSIA